MVLRMRGGGGVDEKSIHRGDYLKRVLRQFADLRWGEAWQERGGLVFLRGRFIPQCILLR